MRSYSSLLAAAVTLAVSGSIGLGNSTVSDFDTGTYYGGTDAWFPYGAAGAGLTAAPVGSGADTSNWMYVAPYQYYCSVTNQDWANPGLQASAFQENSNLEFDMIIPGSGPNIWLPSNPAFTFQMEFQLLDASNTVLSNQLINVTIDTSVKDQAFHVIVDYSSLKPFSAAAAHYNLSFGGAGTGPLPGYDYGWDPANASAIPYAAYLYLDNIVLTPSLATWNNSGGSGDGMNWDATQVNFNDGTNPIAYSDGSVIGPANGNAVAFTDANNANYTVNLAGNVHPRSVAITTAKAYSFTGTGNIGTASTVVTIDGGGSVTLASGVALPGKINVNSGQLILQGNIGATPVALSMASLSIGNGAKTLLKSSSGAPNVLTTKSLTIAGASGAWVGKLDIANNAVILEADGTNNASVLANAQDQAKNTSGGTAGITSTSVAADPTHKVVVVVDNSVLALTLFNGSAVDANSVLIEATYYGDSNLDRKVDVTDLGTLATNYGKSVPNGLLQGDFNGDGKVDVTDLGMLATDYGLGTTGGAFSAAAAPEPATLAIVALSAMPLLMRRRQRH